MNPRAVEEATRPLQQQLRALQLRQRDISRELAAAQAALQAALARRAALEIKVGLRMVRAVISCSFS